MKPIRVRMELVVMSTMRRSACGAVLVAGVGCGTAGEWVATRGVALEHAAERRDARSGPQKSNCHRQDSFRISGI